MEFEPSGEDSLTGVAKVIVSGYISGSMLENTKIRDIYGKDLHTSSIEALVGDPVNIESTGEFDSMTITFEYTDDLNEKNLRVMWYDENNYEYVVLNNYTLNRYSNTISITTDHFSKYMLIDEEVWVNTWINACYEVDHTTNMFIGGYLRSPSSYKDYMIDRFGDDDHDGLANVWEEGGMINNIGHVVHSNPGKRLSDDDSLADGVEMGKLSLLEDIFERSPYTTYRKNGYPVSAGSRWEDFAYFKCISDVELSDSDYDGAFDGDDATSNDKNGPINYILIARDHDGEDMLSCMRQPYINAFNELGQKVVILEMWKESDYYRKAEEFYYRLNAGREVSVFTTFIMAKSTFDWLQYDLEANTFTSKNAYTHVEKMIIIAHGASNRIEFDINDSKDGYISSEDVINAVNPVCKINLFDIQACYCAKPSDYSYEDINHKTIDTTTCIAYEFFKKDNIQKVYAWTDQSGFAFGQNVSLLGAYVVFYYEAEGGVGLREVKSNRYFWIWPAYKPLYYGS